MEFSLPMELWSPPPKLSVSEWADTYRVLSPEAAAEPGRWKTLSFQKEILDSIKDNEKTVVMSSAQVGKTEILLCTLGYYIHYKPAPILVVQPTLQMGSAFSKDRLAPMIRDTYVLSNIVQTNRTKDGSNTMMHKVFRGGHVTISGANSPASLASRPIKVLLCDEVDRFGESAGAEGDPLFLAQKRCATFKDRKFVFTSTPTVSGASRIEDEYKRSSMAIFQVPCPFCETFQDLVWSNVRYEKDCLHRVHYQCKECGKLIPEGYKKDMVNSGKWFHRNPDIKVKGFHLNELISPWRSWEEVAYDYESSVGDIEKEKVFVNTSLGLPFELPSEAAPDWRAIYARRKSYTHVPDGCVALTAGVDCQNDRLEITVLAHCYKQTYVLDHVIFNGYTNETKVWKELSEYIHRSFSTESGEKHYLKKVCVDSQYRTTEVLNWCRFESRSLVVPIRGNETLDTHISIPKKVDVKQNGRSIPSGIKRFNIGIDIIKSDIYSRLSFHEPTELELRDGGYPDNFIHFPELSEEYFRQLTAEKAFLTTSGGKKKYTYKQIYSRNEALDCMVYAFGGFYILGLHRWSKSRWEQQLSQMSS